MKATLVRNLAKMGQIEYRPKPLQYLSQGEETRRQNTRIQTRQQLQ